MKISPQNLFFCSQYSIRVFRLDIQTEKKKDPLRLESKKGGGREKQRVEEKKNLYQNRCVVGKFVKKNFIINKLTVKSLQVIIKFIKISSQLIAPSNGDAIKVLTNFSVCKSEKTLRAKKKNEMKISLHGKFNENGGKLSAEFSEYS